MPFQSKRGSESREVGWEGNSHLTSVINGSFSLPLSEERPVGWYPPGGAGFDVVPKNCLKEVLEFSSLSGVESSI
jgi:hypothetical protein